MLYLCVLVVPLQHSWISFNESVNEAHQPGCLTA